MKRVVLDASAVMTFFNNRPGAERVERLFTQVIQEKAELFMCVVNWGEVFYSIWRTKGRQEAETVLTRIAQFRIRVIPADSELTKLAAGLLVRHRLPYADCFAAALAQQQKAMLATGDRDFKPLEKSIHILWVDAR